MKIIFALLQNKLIKTTAIGAILYFALFSNKKNPDSLANRLSSENIKKNFQEVKQQSDFIITNIEQAQKQSKENEGKNIYSNQDFSTISYKDEIVGTSNDSLKCGDEAEISYYIRVAGGSSNLEEITTHKIIIGSDEDALIEKKIIGMKQGGIRIIKIPRNFKSGNQKLDFILKFNENDIEYHVTLLSFSLSSLENKSCVK